MNNNDLVTEDFENYYSSVINNEFKIPFEKLNYFEEELIRKWDETESPIIKILIKLLLKSIEDNKQFKGSPKLFDTLLEIVGFENINIKSGIKQNAVKAISILMKKCDENEKKSIEIKIEKICSSYIQIIDSTVGEIGQKFIFSLLKLLDIKLKENPNIFCFQILFKMSLIKNYPEIFSNLLIGICKMLYKEEKESEIVENLFLSFNRILDISNDIYLDNESSNAFNNIVSFFLKTRSTKIEKETFKKFEKINFNLQNISALKNYCIDVEFKYSSIDPLIIDILIDINLEFICDFKIISDILEIFSLALTLENESNSFYLKKMLDFIEKVYLENSKKENNNEIRFKVIEFLEYFFQKLPLKYQKLCLIEKKIKNLEQAKIKNSIDEILKEIQNFIIQNDDSMISDYCLNLIKEFVLNEISLNIIDEVINRKKQKIPDFLIEKLFEEVEKKPENENSINLIFRLNQHVDIPSTKLIDICVSTINYLNNSYLLKKKAMNYLKFINTNENLNLIGKDLVNSVEKTFAKEDVECQILLMEIVEKYVQKEKFSEDLKKRFEISIKHIKNFNVYNKITRILKNLLDFKNIELSDEIRFFLDEKNYDQKVLPINDEIIELGNFNKILTNSDKSPKEKCEMANKFLLSKIEKNTFLSSNVLRFINDILFGKFEDQLKFTVLEFLSGIVTSFQQSNIPEYLIMNNNFGNQSIEIQSKIIEILGKCVETSSIFDRNCLNQLENIILNNNNEVLTGKVLNLLSDSNKKLKDETLKIILKYYNNNYNDKKMCFNILKILTTNLIKKPDFNNEITKQMVKIFENIIQTNRKDEFNFLAIETMNQLANNSIYLSQELIKRFEHEIFSNLDENSSKELNLILEKKSKNLEIKEKHKIFRFLSTSEFIYMKILKDENIENWVVKSSVQNLIKGEMNNMDEFNQIGLEIFFKNIEILKEHYQNNVEIFEKILAFLGTKKLVFSLDIYDITGFIIFTKISNKEKIIDILDNDYYDWQTNLRNLWLTEKIDNLKFHFDKNEIEKIVDLLGNQNWRVYLFNEFLEKLSQSLGFIKENIFDQIVDFLTFLIENNSKIKENWIRDAIRIKIDQDSNSEQNFLELSRQLIESELIKHDVIELFSNNINSTLNELINYLSNNCSYETVRNFLGHIEFNDFYIMENFKKILDIINEYKFNKEICEMGLNKIKFIDSQYWQKEFHNLATSEIFKGGQERNLEKLIDLIYKNTPNLEFTFERKELLQKFNKILELYDSRSNILDDCEAKIQNWSRENIENWAAILKFNKSLDLESTQNEMIAIIKRAVKIHYKFELRTIQLLSLIILLRAKNGRLLQINTGEGKSIIVAILAVIKALEGNKVDVITTSTELSIPEVRKRGSFFAMFELTVGENFHSEKLTYKKNIVYGTASNFQRDILKKEYFKNDIRGERGFGIAIVDEVDSMFIDGRSNSVQISSNMPAMQHLEIVLAVISNYIDQIDSHFVKGIDGTEQVYYISESFKIENGKLFLLSGNDLNECIYEIDDKIKFIKDETERHLMKLLRTNELELKEWEEFKELELKIKNLEEDLNNLKSKNDNEKDVKCKILYLEKDLNNLKIKNENEKDVKCKIENLEKDLNNLKSKNDNEKEVKYKIGYLKKDLNNLKSKNDNEKDVKCKIENLEKDLNNLKNKIDNEKDVKCKIENSLEIILMEEKLKNFLDHEIKEIDWIKNKRYPILEVPNHLHDFSIEQLSNWINSALDAKYVYKLKKHYDIIKGRIIPIDFLNTGVLQNNMLWSNGLCQFLQIKENLILTPETLSTNFISNVEFFRRYKNNLYGLTGTLGSDSSKSLLCEVYNTDTVIIPPYKENKISCNETSKYICKELSTILVDDQKNWYETIFSKNLNKAKNGQAVLIICKYVDEVEKIEKRFKGTYNPDKIFKYTGQTKFEKTNIEEGEIIIATNIAGRGTDIKTSDIVEKNGGLHVCITFLPDNLRVELQNIGRTAREGKNGTAQLIIFNKANKSIQDLRSVRDKNEANGISNAFKEVEKMEIRDELFKEFCKFRKKLYPSLEVDEFERKALEERWAIFLCSIENEINRDENKSKIYFLKRFKEDFLSKILLSKNSIILNPHYHVLKGNMLVIKNRYDEAIDEYNEAVNKNPKWSVNSHYNKAHAILKRNDNNDSKEMAIKELKQAKKIIKENYYPDIIKLDTFVNNKPPNKTNISNQLSNRMSILEQQEKFIDDALDVLKSTLEKNRGVDIELISLNELFKEVEADNIFNEIKEAEEDGSIGFFKLTEKKPPPKWWEILAVFFIGLGQIIAGTAITLFSFGAASQIGMALITEGVSDMIYSVKSSIQGKFDWKDWGIQKGISMLISFVSAGFNAIKNVVKFIYKAAKTISVKAKNLVSNAVKGLYPTQKVGGFTKDAIKLGVKKVGKEVGKQLVEFGINQALDKTLSREIEKIVSAKVENKVTDLLENNETIKKAIKLDNLNKNNNWQNQLIQYGLKIINPEHNKLLTISKQISVGIASAKIDGFGKFLQSAELSNAIYKLLTFLDDFKSEYNIMVNEKKIEIEMELEKKIKHENELKNDSKNDDTTNEQSIINFNANGGIEDIEDDEIKTIDIRNQNNYSSDSRNSNEKLKPTYYKPSKIDSISLSLSTSITSQMMNIINNKIIKKLVNMGMNKLTESTQMRTNKEIEKFHNIREIKFVQDKINSKNMKSNNDNSNFNPIKDPNFKKMVNNLKTDGEGGLQILGPASKVLGISIEIYRDRKYEMSVNKKGGIPIKLEYVKLNNGKGHWKVLDGKEIASSGKNNCLFDALSSVSNMNSYELRNRIAKELPNHQKNYDRIMPKIKNFEKNEKSALYMGGARFTNDALKTSDGKPPSKGTAKAHPNRHVNDDNLPNNVREGSKGTIKTAYSSQLAQNRIVELATTKTKEGVNAVHKLNGYFLGKNGEIFETTKANIKTQDGNRIQINSTRNSDGVLSYKDNYNRDVTRLGNHYYYKENNNLNQFKIKSGSFYDNKTEIKMSTDNGRPIYTINGKKIEEKKSHREVVTILDKDNTKAQAFKDGNYDGEREVISHVLLLEHRKGEEDNPLADFLVKTCYPKTK